ncbi:UDP-N-acetylmuramate dehydrogenase [Candidatus Saccharibacteria bacterium]|nr:UDP-N-acetylmuramate dehydrogenase [Candidatus Saccharibacteria bacterium]
MKKHKNIYLKNYTSLKVGGPAETLLELEEDDDLVECLQEITGQVWVFGSGTNSLISDKGLPGTVIINNCGKFKDDDTTITADSGVNWDQLVQFAISKDLYGLELMSGIPGGVGAAIVGNIAAYGQKIADTFIEATVFNLKTQEIKTLIKNDLKFDYRTSSLASKKHDLVILNATFKLSKKPTMQLEYDSALNVAKELQLIPHSLKDRRTIIMETRKRAGSLLTKDAHATAGSFFKNPIVNQEQVDSILKYEEAGISKQQLLRQNKIHGGSSVRVSAALVLLAAGFKRGQTWGNVRLHPDHILKIENTGKAKAQEIHDVVHFITGTVKSRLNIDLEPEVRFIGSFN